MVLKRACKVRLRFPSLWSPSTASSLPETNSDCRQVHLGPSECSGLRPPSLCGGRPFWGISRPCPNRSNADNAWAHGGGGVTTSSLMLILVGQSRLFVVCMVRPIRISSCQDVQPASHRSLLWTKISMALSETPESLVLLSHCACIGSAGKQDRATLVQSSMKQLHAKRGETVDAALASLDHRQY